MPVNKENVFSTGQMKAQSFSVQLSSRIKCNGGCTFCISRTTPGLNQSASEEVVKRCDLKRLEVGLNYAKYLGATHTILTGKADPTQEDPVYLINVARLARKYLPLLDMHTNGFLLQAGPKKNLLSDLVDAGLTMITYSIASMDIEKNREIMKLKTNPEYLIKSALDLGLLVRCSLVICKSGVNDLAGIMDYITRAGNLGAQMIVIREVWIPEIYDEIDKEVYEWNVANKINIGPLEDEFKAVAENKNNEFGIQLRDPLPWGTPVFAVGGIFNKSSHGVNVTFARCDEANFTPVMKSIVHKPDGHGYRNWDHDGDILY